MSRNIAYHLEKLGHTVSFFPTEARNEDLTLWIRPPHYIAYKEFAEGKTRGIPQVFFTMHELATFDGPKANWAELLNRCDKVIVPTFWNQEVFKKLGVTVPITIAPLGVNAMDFPGSKSYVFSILTVHDALGSDGSREAWKDTLNAYYKAFYQNHNVFLTIKSYNIKRKEFYAYVRSIQQEHEELLPPVEIVDVDLDVKALNDLYASHWLFVKNANREGWSLPLLEAMATGMHVAYSDIPVLDWAKDYKKGTTFKAGNSDELAEIFKKEFKEWKKEKGWIESFSWKNCVEKVNEALNDFSK